MRIGKYQARLIAIKDWAENESIKSQKRRDGFEALIKTAREHQLDEEIEPFENVSIWEESRVELLTELTDKIAKQGQ